MNAEALASALMMALAPDPAGRFGSCTKFVEAVRAAVHDVAPTPTVEERGAAPTAVPLPLDVGDLKGPGGTPVAPGKYTLNVETRSSSGDVTVSVPFEIGSQPVTAMGTPMGGVRSASINCK